MELRGVTVLVTGANGFVGPWAVRALSGAGARIVGTAWPSPPAAAADLPVESWQTMDVRDPASIDGVIAAARPGAILHLAGQSSAARSFAAPAETFEVNALGTWRLLEATRTHVPRARVVVVTSGEQYGPQPVDTLTREDALPRPVSPYGLSKAAADLLAELSATRDGLDVIRARAFGHTGPGQSPGFAVPAFAQQLAAIESGRAEPLLKVGNLDVVRDLTDVRDVARAYVALFERGRTGRAYNVCRGQGVPLTEVVNRLCAAARVRVRIEPDPARMRPSDVPWLVGDPAAIAADTGWRAEIPLEGTLEDVLEDWRQRAP
jgi:GDP-4-dehydro-6-deoxy-D-mannose reductase